MRETVSQVPYRPTESKYKGGAREMYVTYDLEQRTRGGTAIYPRVKRVYIAGDVKDWAVGTFAKRTGRRVHGVKINYEQKGKEFQRRGFTATRGTLSYEVRPARFPATRQTFTQVVEVPADARNVQFHPKSLPTRYRARYRTFVSPIQRMATQERRIR
jgi:hypothetical protein